MCAYFRNEPDVLFSLFDVGRFGSNLYNGADAYTTFKADDGNYYTITDEAYSDAEKSTLVSLNDKTYLIKMYYRIGGEKDPPCNPNNLPLKKASAGPFVHSFSNLEDNQRTTGTGMENTGDDVLIYPNPMSDRVTVKIGQHHTLPFRLRITDLSGRVIKETMQYEHIIELDRGNVSSGAYIIEVTGEVVYKGVLMVR